MFLKLVDVRFASDFGGKPDIMFYLSGACESARDGLCMNTCQTPAGSASVFSKNAVILQPDSIIIK